MSIQVKICGLTTVEDIELAAEAGADLLGFILHPKSARYVAPETIAQLLAAVDLPARPQRPRTVGVFVNSPPPAVQAVLSLSGLDLAQLHGDETAADLKAIGPRAFKVLRPQPQDDLLALARPYLDGPAAETPQLMVDAYSPDAYGGTGHRADWALAARAAQHIPRLLLAGGLNPANVAAAIEEVRPWGIDVSSGAQPRRPRPTCATSSPPPRAWSSLEGPTTLHSLYG